MIFGIKLMWLVLSGLLLQGRWGMSIPISVIWSTLPRGNSGLFPSRNHTYICCEAQNSNKHLTAISFPLTQAPWKQVVRSLTILFSFFHESLIFSWMQPLVTYIVFFCPLIKISIMSSEMHQIMVQDCFMVLFFCEITCQENMKFIVL